MVVKQYFVGLDVGSSFCKAIALNSDGIADKIITPLMGNPERATRYCLKELSKNLNSKPKKLSKATLATGLNSDKVSIEDKESEVTCIGKGIYNLNPIINLIVDVGAFSMKALKLNEEGNVEEFLMNTKCAGGSGILLELVAEALELDVSDVADVAFKSKNPIQISSQCSIFAESEVISHKNEGADISDLLAGVCNSVAGRIYPMILRLDKTPNKIAFTGGVAKNKQVVHNLEERLDLKLVNLPLDPQYIPAYGAAVLMKHLMEGH